MRIKIGHASIDENGNIAGGKVGDQTGRELCIRSWYDKPFNVYLECNDAKLAEKAAKLMEQICANQNFGYDQDQRLTGYNSIKKYGIEKASGEFDCSTLISTIYKLLGLNISESNTTSTLRQALIATGKFNVYTDAKHVGSDSYAMRGGIYLSEGHHVVMALENGINYNPYPVPARNIHLGCKGEDVKWVQYELIKHGITKVVVNGKVKTLTVDGKCGPVTEAAIKAYQAEYKLKIDGDCGPVTRGSFIAV